MNKIDLDKRQSIVVDSIRFPLSFFMIVSHMLPFYEVPTAQNIMDINWYNFVSEMFSHTLAYIIPPFFFLFSGYFFFRKMEKWSSNFYGNQLRKRIKTLLIPYLLWNSIAILAALAVGALFSILQITSNNEPNILQTHTLFELFYLLPVNFPLWYVRDLLWMSLLSPLFYLLHRYTRFYGLIALYIIHLSGFSINYPGFSPNSFMYFGLGSYLGFYRKNILSYFVKYQNFIIILFAILLPVITYFNGAEFHKLLIRLYVPIGIAGALSVINIIINNEKILKLLRKLSPTAFFIYAAHLIYILPWLKGAFHRIAPQLSQVEMLLLYLIIPIIATIIILIIFYLLKKITPKLLALLVGGRV